MKILAIEKELGYIDWEGEKDMLESEARRVYELQIKGYVREIYFNEDHNAIIVLECETKGKARELLNSLALVIKGLIDFDMTKLSPYTGFERIIKI